MMRTVATIVLVLILLVLGQVLLQSLLFLAVALRASLVGETMASAQLAVTGEPLALGMAQALGLGVVILLGVRTLAEGEPPSAALGLAGGRDVPISTLVAALVLGLSLQLPLVELMSSLSDLVPWLARSDESEARVRALLEMNDPIRALSVPLAVVAVPALSEELLFRGLVLGRLGKLLPPWAAVVLVAVLFGVFHLEPLAIVYATLAGLLLGAITLRAGTILPAVAVHAGFNALPVLLPPSLVSIDGFNTIGSETHVPLALVGASLVIAVCAGALVVRGLPPVAE